ncbi:MAG: hypothetical protein ACR2G5_10905 [Pyrinomonadaceae bacterium]
MLRGAGKPSVDTTFEHRNASPRLFIQMTILEADLGWLDVGDIDRSV